MDDEGLRPDEAPAAPAGLTPLRSAGMTRRVLATLVDMVVLCGLCGLLAYPVARSVNWSSLPTDFEQVAAVVTDPFWVGRAAGILGMWIALWWSYFLVGWGLLGATPGKWAMGLRIVDHKLRFPIGVSRAALRLSAYAVSSITLGGGHLLILFRYDRCALHDLLAGTQVVPRSELLCLSRDSASAPAFVISDSEQRQSPHTASSRHERSGHAAENSPSLRRPVSNDSAE